MVSGKERCKNAIFRGEGFRIEIRGEDMFEAHELGSFGDQICDMYDPFICRYGEINLPKYYLEQLPHRRHHK